jgi:septal ring factor EnvC (AmiA/AmiB activator)
MEIKEKSKADNKWLSILLVVVCCCNLVTCNKSCTKERALKKATVAIEQKDSAINNLQHQNDILNERLAGYDRTIAIQDSAMNKISNAKKNINVTVKTTRKK